MYSFFLGIQYVGIIILLCEIFYISMQKPSRIQTILLIMTMATLVNFVGYLFELQSTTQEMAINAVKVIYLGKPYVLLMVVIFVLYYFDIKYPKLLTITMACISICITVLVLTCEKQTLFYSSIDFVDEGFFPHLELGHGIVYIIYTSLIFIYLLCIGCMCFIKLRDKNLKNAERKTVYYLLISFILSIVGLGSFLLGITGGYDTTVPVYLVYTFLLMEAMLHNNLLDPMNYVKEKIMDEFSEGLAVINDKKELIYANSVAKQIFERLSHKNESKVIEYLKKQAKSEDPIAIDDYRYKISEKEIVVDNDYLGKMYVIADITENYNHTIQLEKQRAIADQANHAKSVFLAKMSHEIRTPINGIIGMNEMILREKTATEQTRLHAMDVKSSAYALLDTVNDILDLSKIESGKMELVLAEYDVASMLNDVVNTISVKAAEKDLSFQIDVSATFPAALYGDELRIRQIFMNLLSNAVKYTEKGTITLRVSEQTIREDIIMHITVEDTGRGIKEEDMPKLFADFERIEEKSNHYVEGTGLGMSITRQLIEMMEGDIHVESVYGEGTRFDVEIAQKVVNDAPIGDFQKKFAEASRNYTYRESFKAPDAKILVVDDNAMNRKVFCKLLQDTEIQITDIDTGMKCLTEVQNQKFDIIFLDHMMPEMDGEQTLLKMKELPQNLSKDAPVVMLTANAIEGAKEHYLEVGFDEFLSKPIISDKLEKMIQRLLPKELIQEVSD